MSSLQTDPSNMPYHILKCLKQTIENNITDDQSCKEMKQTIHDLLDLLPRVKLWNDELLENFLQLDNTRRGVETKSGENLPFDSCAIQQQLHKVKKLLLKDNLSYVLERLKQTIERNPIGDHKLRQEIKQTIHELLDIVPRVKLWSDEALDEFLKLVDNTYHSVESRSGANFQEQLQDIRQLLLSLVIDEDENHLRTLSSFEQYIVTHADNPIVKSLRVSYDLLDEKRNLKVCLLFLAIFPEKAVLKKKLVIYWWIGEGLVRDVKEGEEIFNKLLQHEFIRPYEADKFPGVSKFQIHPWIRYMLITIGIEQKLLWLEEQSGKPCFDPSLSLHACLIDRQSNFKLASSSTSWDDDYLKSIYNVSAVSLKATPTTLAEFKKLVVLQLGQWQHSVSRTRHIQVRDDSFLSGLNIQKQLKYLSLRGISRIFHIPDSITHLISLEILDLKACHNLETLPSDISPLKKLTHLDVSQCYMLESMPKGLEKLTSLQVLDGFMIGNSHKSTPFKIGYLQKMPKLEKLGIHIARGHYLPADLDRLNELGSNVMCLKISWGSVSEKKENSEHILTFPPSLKKLKLQGTPSFSRWSEWLKTSNLTELKELYIKGDIKGDNLRSVFYEVENHWKVEVLILKYTKDLEFDGETLKSKVGSLKYVKNTKVNLKDESSEDKVPIDFKWL